ncbi:MAG: RNA methyltransferase [Muribaculaceae bacterium]|nr:RNA methyltransferase [Muribaculaceae bacterium]
MTSDFQLTNNLKKVFSSLDDSKGRRRSGMFVAEGTKCVVELASAFKIRYLFAKKEWLDANAGAVPLDNAIVVNGQVLREITRLNTIPPVVAFFELPQESASVEVDISNNLVLALDRVQDPGNMGTILRTCDWSGVHTVLASADSVDAFNPKVVQASMGALARVKVVYVDLPNFLRGLDSAAQVYGTFLDGENIYTEPLSSSGIVVMGNEGQGISPEVEESVTKRIFIPPHNADDAVESLNVATAAAITLSQFRARAFTK